MKKNIEFFYDFGSPASYLAWAVINKIKHSDIYTISEIPVLLGGIFKLTGNRPPGEVKQKATYMGKDLKRYAKMYEVEFNFNDNFPVNTLSLMRGAIAAQTLNIFDKYNECIFLSMWRDNANLSDIEIVSKHLLKYEINPSSIYSEIEKDIVKDNLKENTSTAVKRGVFGVPTFFVNNEMYFGQDRMHWFIN